MKDESMRRASVDDLLKDEVGGADVLSKMRLAVSQRDHEVHIASLQTCTTLRLPEDDVPLLIETLRNLGRTALSLETRDLDPSS